MTAQGLTSGGFSSILAASFIGGPVPAFKKRLSSFAARSSDPILVIMWLYLSYVWWQMFFIIPGAVAASWIFWGRVVPAYKLKSRMRQLRPEVEARLDEMIALAESLSRKRELEDAVLRNDVVRSPDREAESLSLRGQGGRVYVLETVFLYGRRHDNRVNLCMRMYDGGREAHRLDYPEPGDFFLAGDWLICRLATLRGLVGWESYGDRARRELRRKLALLGIDLGPVLDDRRKPPGAA